MQTLSDSTRTFILPQIYSTPRFNTISNSFTDAVIIFNMLLTSPINYVSVKFSAENKNYYQANGKWTTKLNTVRTKFLRVHPLMQTRHYKS